MENPSRTFLIEEKKILAKEKEEEKEYEEENIH